MMPSQVPLIRQVRAEIREIFSRYFPCKMFEISVSFTFKGPFTISVKVNAVMTLEILFSLETMEPFENGLQPNLE